MIDDNGTVIQEVRLAHPVERVWRALTDRDELAKWLMGNDFRPEVGHRFHFDGRPSRGPIAAEVLAVEPPRLLRCRWQIDGAPTTVTMTLEPDGDGTRLRVEHAGLPDEPRPTFEGGWVEKFDDLARTLEATP